MTKAFPRTTDTPGTLIEVLVKLLARVDRYNEQEQSAPVALLWPDPDGEFFPAIPLLKTLGLSVFTLGDYSPDQGQGPALWLRCVVDRTLEMGMREEAIPILYLPKVNRIELRAGDAMRKDLIPLASLIYDGAVFFQKNGREWTLEALLRSDASDLDPSKDGATREAMRAVTRELLQTPLRVLRERGRLESEDFYRILTDDLPRDMLLWIGDPKAYRTERESEAWTAFAARSRANLDFDPDRDPPERAAEKLGLRQNGWEDVWERYAQSPALYPTLAGRLRKARPDGGLFQDYQAWPQDNEERESELRSSLIALAVQHPDAIRSGLQRLEAEHGVRRSWVWAKLGQSPLATALAPLTALAGATAKPLSGLTREELLSTYASEGYRADTALLEALQGRLPERERQAIEKVARSLYAPWADAAAKALQEIRVAETTPPYEAGSGPGEPGTCWVFVDGLRYDIAASMILDFEKDGFRATLGWRMAALPTVTASAKPASTPFPSLIRGVEGGKGFSTRHAQSGLEMNAERLRDLIAQAGFQILGEGETGAPETQNFAWTETGSFDAKGHSLERDLIEALPSEIARLKERILALLEAGWKRVRVVTDHGWLYMPGGLPKVELPRYLVESRWARCAELAPGGKADIPTVPWSWDPLVHVAYAPGIACFRVGHYYAHGGISLQECVVPELRIESSSSSRKMVARIVELRWTHLRLVAHCEGMEVGFKLQLRKEPRKPETGVTPLVEISPEGKAVLMVEDDDLQELPVSCVLIDGEGRILAQKATTVGGD